jgi:hypothetical protein
MGVLHNTSGECKKCIKLYSENLKRKDGKPKIILEGYFKAYLKKVMCECVDRIHLYI